MGDPDLGGGGGGGCGHPDPEIMGWGVVSKKKKLALLTSVWSKNEGGLPPPLLDLPLPLWNEQPSLLQTFTESQKCQNPNDSYLCYADNTQYLWNSVMCSKTELPHRKNLTLVSNVDKAVLRSLFWPFQ